MQIAITVSVIFVFVAYYSYVNKDVVYVKSDVDGKLYLVRDLEDKQLSANILAKLKQNIDILVNELYSQKKNKYKNYLPFIEQLHNRIQNVVISESDGNSSYTSYSINKGEQIIFCLRSRNFKDKLHDMNVIMYVALHEISHVACPEYGHTELFRNIFAFITKTAIRLGIYYKIDFFNNNTEYCGLIIKDSIV